MSRSGIAQISPIRMMALLLVSGAAVGAPAEVELG